MVRSIFFRCFGQQKRVEQDLIASSWKFLLFWSWQEWVSQQEYHRGKTRMKTDCEVPVSYLSLSPWWGPSQTSSLLVIQVQVVQWRVIVLVVGEWHSHPHLEPVPLLLTAQACSSFLWPGRQMSRLHMTARITCDADNAIDMTHRRQMDADPSL